MTAAPWTLLKERGFGADSYTPIRVEIRGPNGSYVHDTVHRSSKYLGRYQELVDMLNERETLVAALRTIAMGNTDPDVMVSIAAAALAQVKP